MDYSTLSNEELLGGTKSVSSNDLTSLSNDELLGLDKKKKKSAKELFPNPYEGETITDRVKGAARAIAQVPVTGATALGDVVAGAAQVVSPSIGDSIRSYNDEQRQTLNSALDAISTDPRAKGTGDFAGNAAAIIAGGRALPQGAITNSALQGAAIGAANIDQGDTRLQAAGQIAKDASIGAALGAIPSAISGIKSTVGKVKDYYKPSTAAAGERLMERALITDDVLKQTGAVDNLKAGEELGVPVNPLQAVSTPTAVREEARYAKELTPFYAKQQDALKEAGQSLMTSTDDVTTLQKSISDIPRAMQKELSSKVDPIYKEVYAAKIPSPVVNNLLKTPRSGDLIKNTIDDLEAIAASKPIAGVDPEKFAANQALKEQAKAVASLPKYSAEQFHEVRKILSNASKDLDGKSKEIMVSAYKSIDDMLDSVSGKKFSQANKAYHEGKDLIESITGTPISKLGEADNLTPAIVKKIFTGNTPTSAINQLGKRLDATSKSHLVGEYLKDVQSQLKAGTNGEVAIQDLFQTAFSKPEQLNTAKALLGESSTEYSKIQAMTRLSKVIPTFNKQLSRVISSGNDELAEKAAQGLGASLGVRSRDFLVWLSKKVSGETFNNKVIEFLTSADSNKMMKAVQKDLQTKVYNDSDLSKKLMKLVIPGLVAEFESED